ncbi:NAD(P)H-dependent oxidoreductase subunit E [Prosthecomicrobium sp. N25]|uniref:NAD(P)H-dependent oxidoreductase subunit E n=1 Tax=Prosthecomicrobium sp. N25 TaxID=3129254 RepID=UPI0030789984
MDIQRKTSGRPGKGRDLAKPKGRPIDEAALAEVRALLGDRSRRRDLLIEHLHLIQDAYGCLQARHLAALALEMRLAQAEVFEVASFYHHFDVVREGEPLPAKLTIRVCDSLSCALAGAEQLTEALKKGMDPAEVRVVHAPCIGRCAEAPAVIVGRNAFGNATPETVAAAVAAHRTKPDVPHYRSFHDYRADGGYRLLEACLKGEKTPEDLIAILSDAGLRGLGGAGFPAGRKWQFVRGYQGPRLMTVNGDEGEPGTFKDRHYLESDPHRMLEGALIAAWAVGADKIYVYMRDEYPSVLEILVKEIEAIELSGLAAHAPIELRRGAGAYICGEESAMIESIEGKRGLPRHRPPYIAEVGLFGRPTLNHNVETLYWIRDIVEKGAAWFSGQGKEGHKGFRSYSVSGRVKIPGVKVAPAGISVKELIDVHCGGMQDGHTFHGFLPGGASGGIFPASMGDLPLDFGTFEKFGGFVGSHAVVILSDKDDVKAAALNLVSFFKDESCGQCTPCRVGTEKMVDLLKAPGPVDPDMIKDLMQVMRDASICGLGQAASNPVNHWLTYFAEETR